MRHTLPSLSFAELRHWSGDGIIGEFQTEEEVREVAQRGLPWVNTFLVGKPALFPHVGADDRAIGWLVGQHFLSRNLRNILSIGVRSHYYSSERFEELAGECLTKGVNAERFDIAFQRIVGCTPSGYRLRHLTNAPVYAAQSKPVSGITQNPAEGASDSPTTHRFSRSTKKINPN